MARIAHLSDLHFGAHDPHLVGAVADDVRAQEPDLVVVSGDVTQRARREEFRGARALLDSLERPWLVVPGNHDLPPDPLRRLVAPRRAFARHMGLHQAAGDDAVRVLAVDSTWRILWKGGRLPEHERRRITAWAEQERAARPKALLAVVAHHPFGALERGGHSLVRNAAPGLRDMAAAGIGLLLTGHDHAHAARPLAERHGGIVAVQAATACSTRLRGTPNGYAVVDVEPRVVRVHARSWDGEAFQPGPPQEFARTQAGL